MFACHRGLGGEDAGATLGFFLIIGVGQPPQVSPAGSLLDAGG